MKKIYTIITLLFLSAMLYAQLPSVPRGAHPISAAEVMQAKAAHHLSPDRSTDFYVDYSTANFDDHFYVWAFNTLYVSTDSLINYIAVALDSMAGYTDLSNPTATAVNYPMCNQFRIDSIFIYVSHQNNSTQYDNFTMKIVTLNASNVPTTTVLWQQTDSTNVSLAGGMLTYAPSYCVSGGTRIGFVFEYRDPTKLDTLAVLAGFVLDPGQANGSAYQSNFHNSFFRYPPFITSITRTTFYGYGTPYGAQGWVECQNWGIFAYVTCDPCLIGIEDFEQTNIRLSQNKPNPCIGNTEIPYYLAKKTNVTFEVRDVTGKIILNQELGVQQNGQHTFAINAQSLGAGVYFYTLKTNEYSLTRKMIVME